MILMKPHEVRAKVAKNTNTSNRNWFKLQTTVLVGSQVGTVRRTPCSL